MVRYSQPHLVLAVHSHLWQWQARSAFRWKINRYCPFTDRSFLHLAVPFVKEDQLGRCPIFWMYKDHDTTATWVDFPSFVMLLGYGSFWCFLLSYAKAVVWKTSGGFLQNGNLGWNQSATQPPVAIICRDISL